jgi:hypothetical protein
MKSKRNFTNLKKKSKKSKNYKKNNLKGGWGSSPLIKSKKSKCKKSYKNKNKNFNLKGGWGSTKPKPTSK